MKTNKDKVTAETYLNYFDYATSARESCIEFITNEINSKYFLYCIYYRPAKKFFKKWLNKHGVNGTKIRIKKVMRHFTNGGFPKFDTEDCRAIYV